MKPFTIIQYISLLLCFTAGFCDTATFVAADHLFSAHVTGNFIVFAYELIKGGAEPESWYKLLTFPIFVIGVMLATALVGPMKSVGKASLLLMWEALMLLAAGMLALVSQDGTGWMIQYMIPGIVVFGMAFQNTYNRAFPKFTNGPTTVMTGNVTQLTMDIHDCIRGFHTIESKILYSRVLLVVSFLLGCISGGKLADRYGLGIIAVMALPALVGAFLSKKIQE